mgnify:FL=1
MRTPGGQALTDLLARQDIWRGRQTRPAGGHAGESIHSGWPTLDALHGGGWPREGLVELYADAPPARHARHPIDRLGNAPLTAWRDWFQASLGYGITALLLPWIAALSRTERVALINPPARPCAERWQREGVVLDNLLLVTPRDLRELGWATEEVLQAGVHPLVLSWLPPLGFALRRRLKLAAESGGSCLVTPFPGQAGTAASPAGIQLMVRRHDGNLAVRRHKPFHPDAIRLRLGATSPVPATKGETTTPILTLAGRG